MQAFGGCNGDAGWRGYLKAGRRRRDAAVAVAMRWLSRIRKPGNLGGGDLCCCALKMALPRRSIFVNGSWLARPDMFRRSGNADVADVASASGTAVAAGSAGVGENTARCR